MIILENIISKYDLWVLIPIVAFFAAIELINPKKKTLIMHLSFLLSIIIFLIIKEPINILCFGYVCSIFLDMCIDDLKTGEIAMHKLLMFMFLVSFGGWLYNFTIGCPCIAKPMLISIPIYIILVLFNEFLNKEISIGGADIYILMTLVITNICLIYAIYDLNLGVWYMADYFSLITFSVFLNFSVYLLGYVLVLKLILKKKEKGIRCLPIFTLPSIVTFLALFHVL